MDKQPHIQVADEFAEMGTPGLPIFSGYLMKAYNAKLYWPSVEPIYSRIWRSDPETSIVRTFFNALSGQQELSWILPTHANGKELDEPTADDLALLDFANSLDSDTDGGLHKWLAECNSRTMFYGFGLWEMPIGVRGDNWESESGWRSEYNDGLIGLQKIAFRDYSSFARWEDDDKNGRLLGMVQNDPPNSEVTIPIGNLLHITYGDSASPEGLATLEAIWRLERVLFQYQLIHGIGSEHAAGHVKFTLEEELDSVGKATIRQAARAMLTAQEGSYITEIQGKFSADIIDTNFQAGTSIMDAIEYYSMLKLTLYGMQFAGMNSIKDVGSYSAIQDSSLMALLLFNTMSAGFVKQASLQIAKRVFEHPVNKSAFPNTTRHPILTVTKVDKLHNLTELGDFVQKIGTAFKLGIEDELSIRRASGVLSEEIPVDEIEEEETEIPEPPNEEDDFDMESWWRLRQDIYSNSNLPHADLIERLNNATTAGELSQLEREVYHV